MNFAFEIGRGMAKEAGLTSEVGGSLAVNAIPLLGAAGNIAGAMGAAFTPTRSEDEQVEASKDTWANFVPGVGAYNSYKRLGRSAADGKKGYGGLMSEGVGGISAVLLSALLGGGLGAGIGRLSGGEDNVGAGAAIGGAAGAGLGLLAEPLAAYMAYREPTWTDKDLEERGGGVAGNLMIPGRATYNRLKRLGHGMKKYDEQASAELIADKRLASDRQTLERAEIRKKMKGL
jgi:hypothetical protein